MERNLFFSAIKNEDGGMHLIKLKIKTYNLKIQK